MIETESVERDAYNCEVLCAITLKMAQNNFETDEITTIGGKETI